LLKKGNHRTTIKLPNPELFTDNVLPTFETWEGQALRKLRMNFWLFPDKNTKFAWVISLVSGDAQLILEPYIHSRNPLAFITAQKMFDHLCLFFSDSDKVGTAKATLEGLWMFNTDDFYVFCAKFVKLAG
jgi:hypothetical protein